MILRFAIGVVVGAGFGFAWHKFAGCPTGACVLARNPVASTIYGAVLGALVAGSFR